MSVATPAQARELITLAVPVLNEEHYIGPCLESLLTQGDTFRLEILVLDGGSHDRTAEIVHALAARHPEIRLVENPARLQSAAVNLAARVAARESRVILRADAHAWYPPGFVTGVVAGLRAQDATSVVVPMLTVGHQGMQRGIAAAQNSRLGNGGSAHRLGLRSEWVDHGHHAAFDRAFFLSIGGYDESFTHNEDAELDQRARAAGGRIWLCADHPVTYFPRKDLASLARQYVKHGAGRARTLLKHRLRPKPRQMAPVIALLGNVAALLVAPFWLPALLVPALYAALCLGWGAALAFRKRDPWLAAAGPAAMVMHMAWGVGFLRSLLRNRGQRGFAVPASAS
ncbi:glycosyltransferase family 2 protein [Roseomonas sp. M0104]|uniref:Glycosyltransferase family 2 protein n=1 Tax=Teichococcus coralli TaxID=2545983 RepID=A0A845BAK9_9PROT|nr:glycosyltransferase family 2 protein [Pseudoroseomonas coralli]MXP64643.1 glycosyltransferase family 2 protein [Pseudoroseomonas coralli]